MKYIKKPVVIEAIQYNNLNRKEIEEFVGTKLEQDVYSDTAYVAGMCAPIFSLTIPTLEGDMTALPGDFIIKGVNGEPYPCKEGIFKKTYAKLSDGMSFGTAIEALKRGNSIRRKGWDGKSLSTFKRIHAHITPAHVANGMIENIDSTTQLLIHDENTSRVYSWTPSVSDIFAEDWEVVE